MFVSGYTNNNFACCVWLQLYRKSGHLDHPENRHQAASTSLLGTHTHTHTHTHTSNGLYYLRPLNNEVSKGAAKGAKQLVTSSQQPGRAQNGRGYGSHTETSTPCHRRGLLGGEPECRWAEDAPGFVNHRPSVCRSRRQKRTPRDTTGSATTTTRSKPASFAALHTRL